MLGFLIGAVCGCAALYCLNRFARSVTGGTPEKAALPLLGNVGAIALALAPTAVWLREQLVWAGAGLAGALVGGAVGLFVFRAYGRRGKERPAKKGGLKDG